MIERRIYRRFPSPMTTGCVLLPSDVEMLDVSLGGISIITSQLLERNDELVVGLKSGWIRLSLKGTVVWSSPHVDTCGEGRDNPKRRAGLKFKNMQPSEFRHLFEILFESLKGKIDLS